MEKFGLNIVGNVLIIDKKTSEIILSKTNDIHQENMSLAIANVISNSVSNLNNKSMIKEMHFGNGGIIVNENGEILYKSSRVNSLTDTLYFKTFDKSVGFTSDQDQDNNIEIMHVDGENYSDIVVTCTLETNEPSGQDSSVASSDLTGDYVFNEIGLISSDDRLLTHLIFHPIQKSSNRIFQIIYTLRFMIVG